MKTVQMYSILELKRPTVQVKLKVKTESNIDGERKCSSSIFVRGPLLSVLTLNMLNGDCSLSTVSLSSAPVSPKNALVSLFTVSF